ncbi:MAG TPA: DUF748 domain-containing protein, partial [Pseudomonadales bacterium]|nr:DUF748 domain-containing protein [Pseudomonadales bacterium]
LTTLSPYSGKFAGYRIKKGKLNLDLNYLVEKRRLKAENNVVLEQLQLGEKVDSPDAVDIPIKLALALMKDSEGKISVAIPIQGNLDNPQFEVGPAIWQTVRTLVLKVVKSPFTMIANLMGGDTKEQPDLSKVPFNAGSDQIDDKSQHALSSLANALRERPELRLDVEGISHKSQDAPLVAQQQLELAYQKSYYLTLQQHGQKVPVSPEQLSVPAEQKAVLLESIYQTTLKKPLPADWKTLDKAGKEKKMTDALLANWSENEGLLRKLAQKRAASIKDYMVQTGKLSEDRIYLLDVNVVDTPTDKPINAILHLDSD